MSAIESTAQAAPPARRVVFIDICRAVAAILVVYTHIDNLLLRDNYGIVTPVTAAIDAAVVAPLKLSDQGPGQISVPLFFLVSGFVVTPVALRYGAGMFALNRVVRIFPLLWVVVALSAASFAAGWRPLTTGTIGQLDPAKIIADLTLVNFLLEPQSALVGVAWTLVVEFFFYAAVVAFLPLIKRSLALSIAVQLTVIHVLVMTHDQFGDTYRLIAVNAVYLTIPIMGQIIWGVHVDRLRLWAAALLLGACWGVFVLANGAGIHENYALRTLPVALALVVFLLGFFAERHLRQRAFWTELSERSYSLYLLHGAVAFPVLHLGMGTIPLWLLVPLALLAMTVVVELSYRLVERPSHTLARSLVRSRRSSSVGTDAVAPPAAPEPIPAPEPGPPGPGRVPAPGHAPGPALGSRPDQRGPQPRVAPGEVTTRIPRVTGGRTDRASGEFFSPAAAARQRERGAPPQPQPAGVPLMPRRTAGPVRPNGPRHRRD